MNNNHKELLSMLLTSVIVFCALFISNRFLQPMDWAGVLGITTFPLYLHFAKLFGRFNQVAAFFFTCLLFAMLMLPLSWIVSILVRESQVFLTYLQHLNDNGNAAPDWLVNLPIVGPELQKIWIAELAHPGDLRVLFSKLHLSLMHTSLVAKQIGVVFAHTSIQIGFTFLTLFFVYRDGRKLFKQIHRVGKNCLGVRWERYATQLPGALRATVNGTILVGLGVGLLMGLCYHFLSIPAPTLLGFVTAICAMIPFVVPIVFGFIALSLISQGMMVSAAVVVIWGTIVMFVADHFVKPVLIGGAIELPFLAVLFGILGGVETMGVLGLFIGPIVMVLFVTLWQEGQEDGYAGLANKS
jgi:predicted PurR-regulated permease PerM